jgi:thymidine kinase
MSNSAKKEYLQEIKKRYLIACKSDKTIILDEFCKVCGSKRKYAIRLIRKKETPPTQRKGQHKSITA